MRTTEARPGPVLDELARIGEGIRIARTRRRMTQEDLASRVGTTFHTIRRIEQGAPGTAIGFYFTTLWVLGLFEDVHLLADPGRDREGLILEASERNRIARPRETLSRDF